MKDQNPTDHVSVLNSEREALGLANSADISALSISGGGIRSATFALGALQGLARIGILGNLDYLSTVSGGGYIGGWLTAWKHRSKGMHEVISGLDGSAHDDGDEPQQIRHLRAYSNYLTPKLGLLSLDFWSLIATVIRNMLLNWTVLLPILMAVLMLPRLYAISIALPEYYFYGDIVPFATADQHGTIMYEFEGLDVISQSYFVRWGLPALVILFFSTALANLWRYLPSIGGVANTPGQYLKWVLSPSILAVWFLDVWNNLFFIGSTNIGSNYDCSRVSALYGIDIWNNLLLLGSANDCSSVYTLFALGGLSAFLLSSVIFAGFNPHLARKLLQRRVFVAALMLSLIPASVAWFAYNKLLWKPGVIEMQWYWAQYTTYSLPFVLSGVALGNMLFAGLTGTVLTEADREWLARATGGLLLTAITWAMMSFVVLLAPLLLIELTREFENAHVSMASIIAAISALLGWLASKQGGKESSSSPSSRSPKRINVLGSILNISFLVFLAIGLTLLTDWLLERSHHWLVFNPHWPVLFSEQNIGDLPVHFDWTKHLLLIGSSAPLMVVLLALAFGLISVVAGRLTNINTFSLQGMYRNRLVRSYLGASNQHREPNPFSGFDENDDIPLGDLDAGTRPYHIINLTLNLVDSKRLDWQQRKASSFVASPLYCGNRQLGYRPSALYGGRTGLSLGTAIATSGAAASPNMGYHSSALVTFAMTLFNARLGIWLGNPAKSEAWKTHGPKTYFIASEMFGMTSSNRDYVYLSDGGHFENLALYEMIARGCNDIIILDGGCDPDMTFEDLGNALRKIKVDMGVDIRFLPNHIDNLSKKLKRCALANIAYSELDSSKQDGRLIYVKPMIRGNESPSILSYALQSPTFPHESTDDQWFNESQIESYRQLGLSTIDEIAEGFSGNGLKDLFQFIENNYLLDSSEAQVR